jgi:DNA-binding transcriptional ArsR family regulator
MGGADKGIPADQKGPSGPVDNLRELKLSKLPWYTKFGGWKVFEPKVTLDQASFHALASETRIAILRALSEHQMTLTELAQRLAISKPGVVKHLGLLQEAGLVLRDTPERKWIYYRLTTKGERIFQPNKTRIMLALGFSVFAVVLGAGSFVALGGAPIGLLSTPGAADAVGSTLDAALSLLPLVLVALGAIVGASTWLMYRHARPTMTDEEILSRMAEVLEEIPGAAPTAHGQKS